jgi:hypothetical protein
MMAIPFVMGQDSLAPSWEEKNVYPIGEDNVWSVDAGENIYVSENGLMKKFNSEGKLMFSQSIKSLGRMTQLIPVNTMKLIHFSEEQQTLCYFDNTLSSMDDCLDLSEEGVVSASLVCGSNQPNKIWVLDNLNSRLLLLSLDGLYQDQEIKNIKGTLEIENITQILERGNHLFLLDGERGVLVFDLYGALIDFFPQKSIQQLDAFENTLFTLIDNRLHILSLDNEASMDVDLPIEGVYEFTFQNHFFFFRTANGVHKYELQFSN